MVRRIASLFLGGFSLRGLFCSLFGPVFLTLNGRFCVKRCEKLLWNIKESKYLYRLFGWLQNFSYLCNRLLKARAFSSAGLEHLPYKQRVGGSNPSTPTQEKDVTHKVTSFFSLTASRLFNGESSVLRLSNISFYVVLPKRTGKKRKTPLYVYKSERL